VIKLRRSHVFSIFTAGFLAGAVALGFNFILRLGGIAAFPPESALSAFLRVIPASIEEPAVEQLGELAGELGLVIATLIAAVVYGVIAVVFDALAARRIASMKLGRMEILLISGIIPWLLFGLVVFPLDGDSIFGIAAPFATGAGAWTFPFTLLLAQAVYAWALSARYDPRLPAVAAAQGAAPQQDVARREFIEKGAIGVLAVLAALVGLTSLFPTAPSQLQPGGGGQPVDLQDAPAIFSDPRIANVVDYEITPNQDFYRVAVDIIDPAVNLDNWSLMVDGLVNTPKQYSLQDVKNLQGTSQYTTFECVSNTVNGSLASNAKWGGVKIKDILADAGGVQPSAKYVAFHSVEGYSVGIPIEKAMMDDSIVAYSMNDQPLPVKHGFPLRGVIPGLYGMMSAKWLDKISVVGSVYVGFWQSRGWTSDATVNTGTFIVAPESSQVSVSQNNGSIILAGYAFAGDRGVSKVEVSLDNGRTWQQAQLKKPLSNLTWAVWAFEWVSPAPGNYNIIARTTDGTGQVQTATAAPPFPGGATGYAAVSLQVTS